MTSGIALDRQGVVPRLMPAMHDRVRLAVKQESLLCALVDGLGSPLNIIFPQNIDDNIESLKAAYKKNFLRGRIYYTSKPCKSNALLRRASVSDIGLDVSSAKSLKEGMGAGFSPDRIEATGPKNADYILTCLQLDVIINADNMAELQMIESLHKKLGLTRSARVYIRLCGFASDRISFTPYDSSFGIHVREAPQVIDWLVARSGQIEFLGFSFHFGTTSMEQRAVAIENQLQLTRLAVTKGLKPKGINIGGSLTINYTNSAEEWQDYLYLLQQSVLGNIASQTWDNSGLGYRNEGGQVVGAINVPQHYHALTKGDELNHILNLRLPGFSNSEIKSVIGDSLLELYIEPGRAMVDQCGMTLGVVNHTKFSEFGDLVVSLNLNQTNVNASQVRNLTESYVIYRSRKRQPNSAGLYYFGNLCTFHDILQYNKQYPELIPEAGDIVCFMNTAPYAMDFGESETLEHSLAMKVALWQIGDQWKWALDKKYLPLEVDA